MGRKHLDTKERANNKIKSFVDELNKKLEDNPKLAETYSLQQISIDFSKYLGRKDPYASSSMLDILKRNGFTWVKSQKRIINTSDLDSFNDCVIHERLYQTFISVSNNKTKKELKHWIENNTNINEDILAVISTPKGLLIISDKDYIKKSLKSHLGANNNQN